MGAQVRSNRSPFFALLGVPLFFFVVLLVVLRFLGSGIVISCCFIDGMGTLDRRTGESLVCGVLASR